MFKPPTPRRLCLIQDIHELIWLIRQHCYVHDPRLKLSPYRDQRLVGLLIQRILEDSFYVTLAEPLQIELRYDDYEYSDDQYRDCLPVSESLFNAIYRSVMNWLMCEARLSDYIAVPASFTCSDTVTGAIRHGALKLNYWSH